MASWQNPVSGTSSHPHATLSSALTGKSHEKKKAEDNLRFQIELEFVQSLGNPHYLNFLAQRGYFKDKKFVNYLSYLQYWKQAQYAKCLKYPQCLYLLDLLQYEAFRKELVNTQCAKFIDDQQLLHWQHYQRKRTRLINGEHEKNQTQQGQGQSQNQQSQGQLAQQPVPMSTVPPGVPK
ncbi:mediator of RNA polymerase II transcription subunit 31-like isoform X1 [Watersipora subatra]|uniref:mediator of RNA polymerase II transcription subunit 31-like isoform X1 n=1 Tax=Watersipora subatra TaxID=2589382 RepID=UPI00355B3A6C